MYHYFYSLVIPVTISSNSIIKSNPANSKILAHSKAQKLVAETAIQSSQFLRRVASRRINNNPNAGNSMNTNRTPVTHHPYLSLLSRFSFFIPISLHSVHLVSAIGFAFSTTKCDARYSLE